MKVVIGIPLGFYGVLKTGEAWKGCIWVSTFLALTSSVPQVNIRCNSSTPIPPYIYTLILRFSSRAVRQEGCLLPGEHLAHPQDK